MLTNYFCYLSLWLEALSDLYACSTDKGLLAERSGRFLIINTGCSAHQSTTVCSLSNLVFPNSPYFLCFTNKILFTYYSPHTVTLFFCLAQCLHVFTTTDACKWIWQHWFKATSSEMTAVIHNQIRIILCAFMFFGVLFNSRHAQETHGFITHGRLKCFNSSKGLSNNTCFCLTLLLKNASTFIYFFTGVLCCVFASCLNSFPALVIFCSNHIHFTRICLFLCPGAQRGLVLESEDIFPLSWSTFPYIKPSSARSWLSTH